MIEKSNRDPFVDFYNTWYRPENFAVIVVGDIDGPSIVKQITDGFSGITARAPAPAPTDLGKVNEFRGLRTLFHPEAEAPDTTIVIATTTPYAHEADTGANRLKYLARDIATDMLNRRLEILAKKENAPFIHASDGVEESFDLLRTAEIEVSCKADQWTAAMSVADQELRRALQFGFRPDELKEAVADFRNNVEQAVKSASTRRSDALAGDIAESIVDTNVFTSPADDLALYGPALDKVTTGQCAEALRLAWSNPGRYIFVAGNVKLAGDANAIINDAYAKAESVAVAPTGDEATAVWGYADFGPAGAVDVAPPHRRPRHHRGGLRQRRAAEPEEDRLRGRHHPCRGPTRNRAADGARRRNPASRRSRNSPTRPAASASTASTTSRRSWPERASGSASPRPRRLRPQRADEQGRLRPRNAGCSRRRSRIPATARRPCASRASGSTRPTFRLSTRSPARSRSRCQGSSRAATRGSACPPKDEMSARNLDEMRAWLTPELAHGALEVTLVGDIDVDAAIAVAAKTIGTLPAREPRPALDDRRKVAFPREPFAKDYAIDSKLPKALAAVYYPTTDGMDIHRARRLNMLAEILSDRLRVKIREQMGSTYAPSVGSTASDVFPGYGYIAAMVEIDPAKTKAIEDVIVAVAADLQANGATPGRARPLQEPHADLDPRDRANEPLLDDGPRPLPGKARGPRLG